VSNEPLLEARGISVRYGAMRALSDVTYRIMPGQVVCLLGGNASGKSTSMKAIFGVVRLATGDVYWQGTRITATPTRERVQMGIAAVPEGRRVFEHLTIEENLLIGAYTARDRSGDAQLMHEMFDLFPRLAERRKQMAGVLSGGEQQMLAIARALMSRPSLICMDEPSMGLSPALVKESFALIERLRGRGTSIFVVEQNAGMALKVADYAYVLSSGELALEGPADEVARDEGMKAAYLGPQRNDRVAEQKG
jgi:branched-chain amino acid transport system ATP-binding protein